jgi:hypothetical protein
MYAQGMVTTSIVTPEQKKRVGSPPSANTPEKGASAPTPVSEEPAKSDGKQPEMLPPAMQPGRKIGGSRHGGHRAKLDVKDWDYLWSLLCRSMV